MMLIHVGFSVSQVAKADERAFARRRSVAFSSARLRVLVRVARNQSHGRVIV